MEGCEVTTVKDCADKCKIFVTTTGCKDTLTGNHFMMMKNNAIICNIGHFNHKIQVKWLKDNCKSKTNVNPKVDKFILANGKNLILMAEGRPINLPQLCLVRFLPQSGARPDRAMDQARAVHRGRTHAS